MQRNLFYRNLFILLLLPFFTCIVSCNNEEETLIPETPTTGTKDGHDWIDLGLPSGTLWATCNIGANTPEDSGTYFAWGETESKSEYKWDYYFDSAYGNSTKFITYYNGWDQNGSHELVFQDDAAYINWGNEWCMPSDEQFNELCKNCTIKWNSTKKGYDIIGPNENQMFLPAAGYMDEHGLDYVGVWGHYWSKTLSTGSSDSAYNLYFDFSGVFRSMGNSRYLGFPIRPVCITTKIQ